MLANLMPFLRRRRIVRWIVPATLLLLVAPTAAGLTLYPVAWDGTTVQLGTSAPADGVLQGPDTLFNVAWNHTWLTLHPKGVDAHFSWLCSSTTVIGLGQAGLPVTYSTTLTETPSNLTTNLHARLSASGGLCQQGTTFDTDLAADGIPTDWALVRPGILTFSLSTFPQEAPPAIPPSTTPIQISDYMDLRIGKAGSYLTLDAQEGRFAQPWSQKLTIPGNLTAAIDRAGDSADVKLTGNLTDANLRIRLIDAKGKTLWTDEERPQSETHTITSTAEDGTETTNTTVVPGPRDRIVQRNDRIAWGAAPVRLVTDGSATKGKLSLSVQTYYDGFTPPQPKPQDATTSAQGTPAVGFLPLGLALLGVAQRIRKA